MGVDLTLLPVDSDRPGLCVAQSMLQCWRRSELWDHIGRHLSAKPFGAPLGCFVAQREDGESGYGDRTDDAYGQPLTYVTAEDLVSIRDHEGVQDNPKNRAVWAYLAELPPDTKIVLFWN